jgi:hypothetical protein
MKRAQKMTIFLLVRSEDRDCIEAVQLVKKKGLEVEILNVSSPEVAPYLVQEIGTAVTPTLVVGNYVLPGLNLIKEFLESET